MSWTINSTAPAALGVRGLQMHARSLANGEFSFTAAGRNVDAAPLFAYLAPVTLQHSGVTRWRGPCIRRPLSGQPGAENHSYGVASPWWYLEQQTFLQGWKVDGGAGTVYLSRCVLGLTATGVRQTMGEVIADVLAFTASCGWPVGAGTITLPGNFPVFEINGMKCAEVIRAVLRWAPDAVGWWTHAGASSQLNIKRRAGLVASALTVGTDPIERVELSPREEMVPGAVVIQYERTDSIDGTAVFTTASDEAPSGADGTEPGAVHYTIDLAGGSVTTLKQEVKTRTIELPTSGSGNAARRYYGGILGLIGKVKAVTGASPETPELFFHKLETDEYFDRTLADIHGQDGGGPYELLHPGLDAGDPDNEKIYLAPDLPRELVEGMVMPWMSGVTAQHQHIRFKISYKTKATSTTPEKQIGAHEQIISVMATDATNRVYQQTESVIFGEEPTVGLAAQMLAALNVPDYQGSVTLLDEECPAAPAIGNVINISGGASGWAGMNAVVQETTEDLHEGTKVLVVGPPEHLGPQDAVELQRCNRRPEGNTGAKSNNQQRRQTGIP